MLRQRLVVEFARLVGIEAEVELVLPAEFEARLGKRVVTQLRARMPFREIGGMRSSYLTHSATAKLR